MGLDGRRVAVRMMLITFHQQDSAGIRWRRFRNATPGISAMVVNAHAALQSAKRSRATVDKMKQELTEALQQRPTNTTQNPHSWVCTHLPENVPFWPSGSFYCECVPL